MIIDYSYFTWLATHTHAHTHTGLRRNSHMHRAESGMYALNVVR